jgi:hypothetical protein
MTEPTRFPLYAPLLQRDATSEKDALSKNVYYDSVENSKYAVKRPGIESFISATGQGLGIFFYDDDVFTFTSPYKFLDTFTGDTTTNLTSHEAEVGGKWATSNLITMQGGGIQSSVINPPSLTATAKTTYEFVDGYGTLTFFPYLQSATDRSCLFAVGDEGWVSATNVLQVAIQVDASSNVYFTTVIAGVTTALGIISPALYTLNADNEVMIDVSTTNTRVYLNGNLMTTSPACTGIYSLVGHNINVTFLSLGTPSKILSGIQFVSSTTLPSVT